jgi:hypothetical protein
MRRLLACADGERQPCVGGPLTLSCCCLSATHIECAEAECMLHFGLLCLLACCADGEPQPRVGGPLPFSSHASHGRRGGGAATTAMAATTAAAAAAVASKLLSG